MRGPLVDAAGTATGTRLEALDRDALVGERLVDHEVVRREAVVDLGVRDRGAEHQLNVLGDRARREQQLLAGIQDVAAADVGEHEARLAGRRADVLGLGPDESGLGVGESLSRHQPRLDCLSEMWPR